MNPLRQYLWVLLLVVGLSPLDGIAGMLQVSPVMVELQAGESASSITLRNPGEQPLYGQVRLFRWDQSDGDDNLEATRDVIASPPIVQIAPHASQLVRIVRIDTAPVAAEQSYRMIVDEIPQPNPMHENGIMIRLRYSLPVFVEPAGPVGQPDLSWRLIHERKGWILRVSNTGKRRAQIAAVELMDGESKSIEVDKGLLGYVLAGHFRQWSLSLPPDANFRGAANVPAAMKVRAVINTRPIEAAGAVEQKGR